jgi:hypothetical protein
LKRGEARPVPKNSAEREPIETRTEIAKAAGVSHDTLAKAKVIAAKAPEAVKKKLRAGKTTIHREYKAIVRAERERTREGKRRAVPTEPPDGRSQPDWHR